MNTCKNYVFTVGTLTVTCFVHAEIDEDGKVIKYHGKTHVKTIHDVHEDDISKELHKAIENYLKKCKFKNCKRTFSWKFESL